ncbi:external NADH-ubiquinone oxidoreductase [Verticillium alfalfae VaMs.102]|uniref:NADH:ubiquinone reductase (non-electrogenic) n=1 Tax=Verticillium alfalfae (strain VaMs.102 / ATCC MYA-4576 / FGSC 10136) TaxID=526221 RepID=C9SSE6_VERA1|nr:external NADH-ubiquinone oxidoreductase [Verticillium alfalfae VaMs.102]EEY21711.1 external NADH-ubiquinone oxidoreductase [Verticillium alfalfae VaMs.102]
MPARWSKLLLFRDRAASSLQQNFKQRKLRAKNRAHAKHARRHGFFLPRHECAASCPVRSPSLVDFGFVGCDPKGFRDVITEDSQVRPDLEASRALHRQANDPRAPVPACLRRCRSPAAPQKPGRIRTLSGSGDDYCRIADKLDTENYNVIVISPRNYFLFTPLLPSCTTGLIEHRSIMEPVRAILQHKKAAVKFYEAEASSIDPERKVVMITDNSEVKGATSQTEIPYDMLVIGVGAENATFGIPGVRENSCFLKEINDAQSIRKKIMDCVETAAFKGQTNEEIDRLLHMVVVGGGPTGVEFAGELQDFFEDDIKRLVPDIADRFKVTLIEALPNVLPSFSKQLIEYTENTFKEEKIDILTKTMVKNVTDTTVEAVGTNPDGSKKTIVIPYGLLVWATGNAVRPIIKELISKIPAQKDSRRGLAVNEYLVVQGTRDIWAIGDCAVAGYAPTAQVAGQEGSFLARLFNNMAKTEELESKVRELSSNLNVKPGNSAEAAREIEACERQLRRIKDVKPFHYTHQGSLAYIGSEKAVADVSWWNGNIASGGSLTFLFWRSAYLSMCFSTRNRLLVIIDWLKSKAFGRDVSRE